MRLYNGKEGEKRKCTEPYAELLSVNVEPRTTIIILGLSFPSAVISLIEIVLHPVPSPALSNVLLLVIR